MDGYDLSKNLRQLGRQGASQRLIGTIVELDNIWLQTLIA